MPLFLTPTSTNASVSDVRFASRNAHSHIQGPVSKYFVAAHPRSNQVAYLGYRENIDAFMAATYMKQKLIISASGYNCPPPKRSPMDFLPFPSVYIAFQKDAPVVKKIKEHILMKVTSELSNVDNVKGVPGTFILKTPTAVDMLDKIALIVHQPDKSIQGTISFKGLYAARMCYLAMFLFQVSNTYPAFTSDIEDTTANAHLELKRTIVQGILPRDMEGWEVPKEEGQVVKKLRTLGGSSKGRDTELPSEPWEHTVPVIDTVSVAKPGDIGAGLKLFGLPKDCPKLPGIVFEYFAGMNSPDSQFLRSYMSSHFFRCFGEDPRSNFNRFKEGVASFADSAEGMVMAHIMRCQEIALQAQAIVYVMFDGRVYLGCVVLGAKWVLQTQNTWFEPESAAEVHTQLGTIKTHETSKSEVLDWLKDHEVENPSFTTAVELARLLGQAKFSEEGEALGKEKRYIDDLVRRLDFHSSPEGFTIQGICKMLKDIGLGFVPPNQHVTFPKPDGYHLLKDTYAVILTRFGSRVPSFIIPKALSGTTLSVQEIQADPVDDKVLSPAKLASIQQVVIAMKPLETSIKDMRTFLTDRKITTAGGERAASFKYHTVKELKKDRLLEDIAQCMRGNPEFFLKKISDAKEKKEKSKPDRALEIKDVMDFIDSLA